MMQNMKIEQPTCYFQHLTCYRVSLLFICVVNITLLQKPAKVFSFFHAHVAALLRRATIHHSPPTILSCPSQAN